MKLEPKYVCSECHVEAVKGYFSSIGHTRVKHLEIGVEPCAGKIIPHYSLPDLESYLSERLSRFKYQQKIAKTVETETIISGRLKELAQILEDLKEAV